MIKFSPIRVLQSLCLGAAALCAFAVFAPRDAAADGPPSLPPEAYAACESKKSGDACTVQFHEHEMQGSCTAHPADNRLFCRPSGPPPPPPEAFDACNGKKVADACSVQMHGHTMEGTCMQTPDSRLVCAPAHHHGPPPGAPPAAP